MCNSRNNNWKKFVEVFLPADVLMENVVKEVIGSEMRAIICKLINKVYVD